MDANKTRITLEILGLRAKTLAYTLIQLTGFAILFYGIQQLAKPFLVLQGYDITLPNAIANALPALPFFEAVGAMAAGMAVVWISTASWF